MKKKFDLSSVIILAILVAAASCIITYYVSQHMYQDMMKETDEFRQEMSSFIRAKSTIEESYIGKIDEQTLEDAAITGLVAGLGDRWSVYMNAKNYAEYVAESNNKYVGIGITVSNENDEMLITEVFRGSPAEDAGLAALETITAIEGESVTELGYNEAISRVKGVAGSSVKLTIKSESGSSRDVSVTRREVSRELVRTELLEGNVGYVRVVNFDKGVSNEFKTKVNAIISQGANSLVFDMRFNPGGSLNELLAMMDMLLPEGDIFMSRDKSGKETIEKSDASCIRMPMAVIVHEDSYSAAEYFAAALQEYKWAKIVGETTFGKGYSQRQLPLGDGSAIILSTEEYFTPHKKSLVGVGVIPDYKVSMSEEQLKKFAFIDHNDDPMLQKAIEVINLPNS